MRTFALLAALLAAASGCTTSPAGDPVASSPLRVTDLRCEHLREPLAIATAKPGLRWRVTTTTPSERGQGWSAFQLQVAR